MSDTLFFFVAKVVGLGLLVETWIAATLAAGLVALLAGRLAAGRTLVALGLGLVLAVGALPLGNLLLAPLEAEYPPEPALAGVTGIIVLGGSEDPAPTSAWGLPALNDAGERVMAAAALAARHPGARVVVSGGSGQIGSTFDTPGAGGMAPSGEALLVAAALEDLGVARDRMILEGASRNTVENARFSHALVRPAEGETWVLVTSAFHIGRSMRSFEAAGWPGLVAWPVDFRTAPWPSGLGWDLPSKALTLNLALKEQVGRIAYRLAGR